MKRKNIFFYIMTACLLILLSSAIIGWLYYFQYQHRLQAHLDKNLESTAMQFDAVSANYRLTADTIFENILDKPAVTGIMAKAADADAARQDALRRELYALLLPLYTNLQKQDIRQFHFHLPEAVSFLRFHRPERFGDSIASVRASIVKVNRSRQPVFGFEEGRIYNGFRHVYPLFHGGTFVGSVEISYPFRALRTKLLETHNAHYHAIFKQDIIEEKVWQEDREAHYRTSTLDERYRYDVASRETCPRDGGITNETINRLNAVIADAVSPRLGSETPYIVHADFEGTVYRIAVLPVINFEHNHAGHILAYSIDTEIPLLRASYLTQAMLLIAANAVLIVLLILFFRATQLKNDVLEKMASTDMLTGIPNRTHFMAVFDHEINNAQRNSRPLSLIFFDIDHFKDINDSHGHDAGDKVLIELASLVSASVRKSDLFARWGGEEFAVILPDTSENDAINIAEKLRNRIEGMHSAIGSITASFGVAQLHHDDNAASFMKRVDTLLYRAKEHGRNRVETGESRHIQHGLNKV